MLCIYLLNNESQWMLFPADVEISPLDVKAAEKSILLKFNGARNGLFGSWTSSVGMIFSSYHSTEDIVNNILLGILNDIYL